MKNSFPKKEPTTKIQISALILKSPQTFHIPNWEEPPLEEKVEYDPKRSIQKRLEDLIPILNEHILSDKIHPHFVDFYKENKQFLTYFETPFSILPNKMKCPYFDIRLIVGDIF